jgi:regulator of sigma E protease
MSSSILAFVVVLGVLIFFHELGHFIVARLFGVGVEKFSLGFGPRIFGKKVGITDYRISAIPLGGYVKMVGDEPDAELDPADIPISFTHKHVLKRFLIVAAGPLFNLVLAIIIFFGIFMFSGTYIVKPTIGKVDPESPAAVGGLLAQDEILAIDGAAVTSWEDMAALIADSQGRTLVITVRREGGVQDVTVTPQLRKTKNLFNEDIDRYIIGIAAAGDVLQQDLSFFQALKESFVQTYNVTELTVVSIAKMIKGTVSAKTIGGPIMIAQLAGQQAKAGATNLLFLIALLSVNLAILNFLPIPVLDGGHLLFFTIEMVIGRPVNTRMREIAQQAGIFILIMIMIFVFYNDITRLLLS